MAVLALPALAQAGALALAGSAGTGLVLSAGSVAAWTIAGGIIDQRFLFPALLGKQNPRAPKLGDGQLTEAFDGQPQSRLVCGTPRVPCAVIYKSKIRQVQDSSGSTGKGGPGSQIPIFKQFVDLGLQVGRRIGPETTVEEILLVFADGKKIYDVTPPPAPPSGTGIVATIKNLSSYGGQKIRRLILTSPDGGPDLSELSSGKTALVSGFVGSAPPFTDGIIEPHTITPGSPNTTNSDEIRLKTATGGTMNVDDTIEIVGHPVIYAVQASSTFSAGVAHNVTVEPPLVSILQEGSQVNIRRGAYSNNGDWDVITSSINQTSGVSNAEFEHPHWDPDSSLAVYPFVAKAAGDPIVVFQDHPTTSAAQLSRIAFKLGARDQDPDRVLVAALQNKITGGAAQVYGGHGRVEIWIEDFELTQFGNHIPFFEAVVRVSGDDSLSNTLSLMFQDAGYGLGDFDVSGVSGTCRGYSYRGAQPLNEDLQPLQTAFQFITSESGAQIIVEDRDALDVISVDYNAREIGLSPPGSRSPRPWNRTKRDDASMPYRIDVSYIDPDRVFVRGTQSSPFVRPDGRSIVTSDLSPLVLSADEAIQVASRMLDVAWSSRVEIAGGTAGPDLYDRLRAGVLLAVENVWSRDWLLLITRCEVASNGLLQFDGRLEDEESLIQTATAGVPV